MPTDTLIDPIRYRPLGIESESDWFGAWVSEMLIGARLDRYPHYAPWYA